MQSIIIWHENVSQGKATHVYRLLLDPVRFPKQERCWQIHGFTFQVSGVMELRDSTVSCCEPHYIIHEVIVLPIATTFPSPCLSPILFTFERDLRLGHCAGLN